MNLQEQELKLRRAKDRVKKIRGFYSHVAIFCFVLVIAVIAPLFAVSYTHLTLPTICSV